MRSKLFKLSPSSAEQGAWRLFFLFVSFHILMLTGGGAVDMGGFELATVKFDFRIPPNSIMVEKSAEIGWFETPVCAPFEHNFKGSHVKYSDAGPYGVLFGVPKLVKAGTRHAGLYGGYVMTDLNGETQLCATPAFYADVSTRTSDPGKNGSDHDAKGLPHNGDGSESNDVSLEDPVRESSFVINNNSTSYMTPEYLELNILIDGFVADITEASLSTLARIKGSANQYCMRMIGVDPLMIHLPMFGIRRVTDVPLLVDDVEQYYDAHSSVSTDEDSDVLARSGKKRKKHWWSHLLGKFSSLRKYLPRVTRARPASQDHQEEDEDGSSAAAQDARRREAYQTHESEEMNEIASQQPGSTTTTLDLDSHDTPPTSSLYASTSLASLMISFLENAGMSDIVKFLQSQDFTLTETFGDSEKSQDFFSLQYLLGFTTRQTENFCLENAENCINELVEVLLDSKYNPGYLRLLLFPAIYSKNNPLTPDSLEDGLSKKLATAMRDLLVQTDTRCQVVLDSQDSFAGFFNEEYLEERRTFTELDNPKEHAVFYMYSANALQNLFEFSWRAWKSMVTEENLQQSAAYIRKKISPELKAVILNVFAPFRLRNYLMRNIDESLALSSDASEPHEVSSLKLIKAMSREKSPVDKDNALQDVPPETLNFFLKEFFGDREFVMIYTCMVAGIDKCDGTLLYRELSAATLVDAFLLDDIITYTMTLKVSSNLEYRIRNMFYNDYNRYGSEDADPSSPSVFPNRIQGLALRLHEAIFRWSYSTKSDTIAAQSGDTMDEGQNTLPKDLIKDKFAEELDDAILLNMFLKDKFETGVLLEYLHVHMLNMDSRDNTKVISKFMSAYEALVHLMLHIREDGIVAVAQEEVGEEAGKATAKTPATHTPKNSTLQPPPASSSSGFLMDNTPAEATPSNHFAFDIRSEYMKLFSDFLKPERFSNLEDSSPAPQILTAYSILRNVAEIFVNSLIDHSVLKSMFDRIHYYFDVDDAFVALEVMAQPKNIFNENLGLEGIYDYFHVISNSCFNEFSKNLSYEMEFEDEDIDSHKVPEPESYPSAWQKEVNHTGFQNFSFSSNSMNKILCDLVKESRYLMGYLLPLLSEEDWFKLEYKLRMKDGYSGGKVANVIYLTREEIKLSIKRFLSWYANQPLYDFNPINWSTLGKALSFFYANVGFKDFYPISPVDSVDEAVIMLKTRREWYYPHILSDPVLYQQQDGSFYVCTWIANLHAEDYIPYARYAIVPRQNSFIVDSPTEVYQYVTDEIKGLKVNYCVETNFDWEFSSPPKVYAWTILNQWNPEKDLTLIQADEITEKDMKLCAFSKDSRARHVLNVRYIAIGKLKREDFDLSFGTLSVNRKLIYGSSNVPETSSLDRVVKRPVRMVPRGIYQGMFVGFSFKNLLRSQDPSIMLQNRAFIETILHDIIAEKWKPGDASLVSRFYTPDEYNAILRINFDVKSLYVKEDDIAPEIKKDFIRRACKILKIPFEEDLLNKMNNDPSMCFVSSNDYLSKKNVVYSSPYAEQYHFLLKNTVPTATFAFAPVDVALIYSIRREIYSP